MYVYKWLHVTYTIICMFVSTAINLMIRDGTKIMQTDHVEVFYIIKKLVMI